MEKIRLINDALDALLALESEGLMTAKIRSALYELQAKINYANPEYRAMMQEEYDMENNPY